MAFALSKLAALAMGRNRQRSQNPDLPVLRRADAHPDAPARKPIFAQSDFESASMFAPFAEPQSERAAWIDEPIPPMPGFALRPEAEAIWMPEPAQEAEPEFTDYEPVEEESAVPQSEWAPGDWPRETACATGFAPLPSALPETAPATRRIDLPSATIGSAALEHLSIAELADRLERGLARRAVASAAPASPQIVMPRAVAPVEAPPLAPSPVPPSPVMPLTGVIADMPVAQPVAVKAQVDMDIDEALRAALGTLHRISRDS